MIKKIKNIFRKILLKFNINVYNFSSKDDILDLLKLFKIKIPKNIELIRIGSNNDGGYLVPNIIHEISSCFSAGIGNNISFEKDLINRKISVFGADGTLDSLPEVQKNYNFLKKNICICDDEENIRFETWVNLNASNSNSLIGQIDIEGGEYNLIIDTPLNVLKKFKILVIEFHNLNLISNKINCNFYLSVFKKILSIFNICHLHINNSEKPINIKGINIPPVIEFTLLRKDFYGNNFQSISIPHKLDQRNLINKDDYFFDKTWLKIIS